MSLYFIKIVRTWLKAEPGLFFHRKKEKLYIFTKETNFLPDENHTVWHLLLCHINCTVPAECTYSRISPPFCQGRRKCALCRNDPLKALSGTVPHRACWWGFCNGDRKPTVMEKQDFLCHGKAGFPSQVVQFTDAHEIWHRQWLYFQRLTQSHTQQNLWRAVGSSQKQSRQKNGGEILIYRLHMPSRFPTGGISVKRWTSLLVK